VVPGVGYGDDFVGACAGEQVFEAGFDGACGSDDGFAEAAFDGGSFEVIPEVVHGVDRRQKLDGLIADETQEALLRRGEEAARGFVGFGCDYGDSHNQPGLLQSFARPEERTVEMRGVNEHLRSEVRRKGEGQSELGSEASAEVAGAEERDGNVAVLTGMSFDSLMGQLGTEIGAKLGKEFGEVVSSLSKVATESAHGVEVAAGSAAEAEVDTAGIEGFKCSELLGYDERGVVGEHDSAAADADGAGRRGDVSDEDGGCGAGKAIDGVVFGEPEAAVAPLLGMACEVDGAGDGGGWRLAGVHADQVEDGDG